MPSFKVFVAMPFAQNFRSVFISIRKAIVQLGGSAFRIDEVWAREDIYKQIEEEIIAADIVIADFTGDRVLDIANPNVVHEATFAYVHKKYLILIAQDYKCLPFDWRTRPAILYQQTEEGLVYLEERLVLAIQAISQKSDFQTKSNAIVEQPNIMSIPPQYHTNTTHSYPDTTIYDPNPYPSQANVAVPKHDTQNTRFIAPMMPTYFASKKNPSPSETMIAFLQNSEHWAYREKQAITLPPGYRYIEKKFAEYTLVVCEKDQSEMVLIPGGEFDMGGNDDDDQKPMHTVYLTPYLMDIYPITRRQYKCFIVSGGYENPAYWTVDGWNWKCKYITNVEMYPVERKCKLDDNQNHLEDDLPIVSVSWYEAFAYSIWAGKHLPTEAQWEYAAKGNDLRIYPWGNIPATLGHANYGRNVQQITPVTHYQEGKSPFGCYDMAGNVWEWCYDWYDEAYYQHSPSQNPSGPTKCKEPNKVCRGGSWNYGLDVLKTYYRFYGQIQLKNVAYGFRSCRILEIS